MTLWLRFNRWWLERELAMIEWRIQQLQLDRREWEARISRLELQLAQERANA